MILSSNEGVLLSINQTEITVTIVALPVAFSWAIRSEVIATSALLVLKAVLARCSTFPSLLPTPLHWFSFLETDLETEPPQLNKLL